MAKSASFLTPKIMNMVYGLGAAVVIVGALFKIQHFSIGFLTGGVMLSIGLGVEAIIFAISAFEPVEDELDWSKVYPELDGAESDREIGPQGLLTQKLDTLLQEANLDAALMSDLSKNIKNFSGAAQGLTAVSETVSVTNTYNDQMSLAVGQMESLNGLHQSQMESLGQMHQAQQENEKIQASLNNAVVENTERLRAQMATLASNLESLNGVYGGMLSAMSNK